MQHHPSICVPSGDEIQKVVTDVYSAANVTTFDATFAAPGF